MANITTQTIRVDLSTDKVIPSAFTHQNDSARTLVFDMYNGGLPYTMTGNTVKFAYKSPIVNGQYTVIAGSSMESGTVSGNTVSVTLPAAYTAISGVGLLTMIITPTSGTIRPVNIKFIVQKSADGDDTIAGASDFPATLGEIAEDWLEENISIQIDDTLSVSGKAADAKVTGDEIANLKSDLQSLEGGGLSNEAKTVLLRCFQNVAWSNDQGQTYYDSLYAALYPPAELVSIRAAFNQGPAVIFDTDSLDTLKQYLTVTAIMLDNTTRTVTNYVLSGTLTKGTRVITVLYGGKSTTFTVEVYSNRIVFQSGISRSGVTGKLGSEENRTASEMIPISDSTITHNVVCKVNGETTSIYTRCFDQNGLAVDADNTIPVGVSAFSVIILSEITNEIISLTIDGVEYPCSLGVISEFSNTIAVNISKQAVDFETGELAPNNARISTDFISVYHPHPVWSQVVAFNLTASSGVYIKVFEYTDSAFLPNSTIGNLDTNIVSGNVASDCTKIRIVFKKTDGSDFTQSDIDSLTLNNYEMVTYSLEEV